MKVSNVNFQVTILII